MIICTLGPVGAYSYAGAEASVSLALRPFGMVPPDTLGSPTLCELHEKAFSQARRLSITNNPRCQDPRPQIPYLNTLNPNPFLRVLRPGSTRMQGLCFRHNLSKGGGSTVVCHRRACQVSQVFEANT